MPIILFRPDYEGSPPTMRIQLALAEKGLSFEEQRVPFSDKPPALLEVNPRGQVPALRDGETGVFETNAILLHLEYAHPEPPLLPRAPRERAVAITRMEEVSQYLMGAFLGFWRYRNEAKGNVDPERLAAFVAGVKDEWRRWEGYLERSGGPFLSGAELSLADLSVFPYLASCARNGLDLGGLPRLGALHQQLRSRPSVQRCWPTSWNTPGEPLFA
jgi:glutathione S-transferase